MISLRNEEGRNVKIKREKNVMKSQHVALCAPDDRKKGHVLNQLHVSEASAWTYDELTK